MTRSDVISVGIESCTRRRELIRVNRFSMRPFDLCVDFMLLMNEDSTL